jgi:dihydroflavonol-4-reductase
LRQLPDWLVTFGGRWNPSLARAATHVGRTRLTSNEPLQTVLGIKPRGLEDMVLTMAESLIAHGAVKKP